MIYYLAYHDLQSHHLTHQVTHHLVHHLKRCATHLQSTSSWAETWRHDIVRHCHTVQHCQNGNQEYCVPYCPSLSIRCAAERHRSVIWVCSNNFFLLILPSWSFFFDYLGSYFTKCYKRQTNKRNERRQTLSTLSTVHSVQTKTTFLGILMHAVDIKCFAPTSVHSESISSDSAQ